MESTEYCLIDTFVECIITYLLKIKSTDECLAPNRNMTGTKIVILSLHFRKNTLN